MRKNTVICGVYLTECFYFLIMTGLLVSSVGFYVSVNQDTSSITQISDEWQRQPIVDIQVIPSGSQCPYNYTALFARQWLGTKVGCDCRFIYSWNIPVMDQNSVLSHACGRNHTRAGCVSVRENLPKAMPDLGGFQVCGKQGGQSFIAMQRPIDLQGNCPKGYQVCNPDADADHRVCTQSQSDCPINDF